MEPKIAVESGSSAAVRRARYRSDIAECPQQMLIDRVVMIHVELHHRDDAAELGNKPAEDAGFVHVPQRYFRIALRGEAATEKSGWLRGSCLQIIVDQPQ